MCSGTLRQRGSRWKSGTLWWRGSLNASVQLFWLGSLDTTLDAVGTSPWWRLRSFLTVHLPQLGSLRVSGTLSMVGSLWVRGTLIALGSLFHFGTLMVERLAHGRLARC